MHQTPTLPPLLVSHFKVFTNVGMEGEPVPELESRAKNITSPKSVLLPLVHRLQFVGAKESPFAFALDEYPVRIQPMPSKYVGGPAPESAATRPRVLL